MKLSNPPNCINPVIAKAFTVNAAVMLEIVEAICLENKKAKRTEFYKFGHYWTCGTLKEYSKLISYLTTSQIRKALNILADGNLIFKECLNTNKYDKTLWYAIDYENLDRLYKGLPTIKRKNYIENKSLEMVNLKGFPSGSKHTAGVYVFGGNKYVGASKKVKARVLSHIYAYFRGRTENSQLKSYLDSCFKNDIKPTVEYASDNPFDEEKISIKVGYTPPSGATYYNNGFLNRKK